jgi:hypothetical protein
MTQIPIITEPMLDRARVDFSLRDFRRALLQHGVPLRWEFAVVCPCKRIQSRGIVVVQSTEARTDCPECRGVGVIYDCAQNTIGIVHDTREKAVLSTYHGQYSEGDVLITMLPEHLPDRWDRLTMKSGVRVYNESRRRTDARYERLRYPIVRRKFPIGNEDGTPGVSAMMELGVLYMRRTGIDGQLILGALVENEDFVITDDGRIDWDLGDEAGTAPEEGAWYSARYYARPVFIVKGLPYVRRDGFTQPYDAPSASLELSPILVHASPEFLGNEGVPDVEEQVPNPDITPIYRETI